MIQEIIQSPQVQKGWAKIAHLVLNWLYVVAHQIGVWVISVLKAIFPKSTFPADIIDPIGFVVILAGFYLLVNLAKGVAKWILLIAAGLIILRIVLIILKVG
jgi:hypothetical protein